MKKLALIVAITTLTGCSVVSDSRAKIFETPEYQAQKGLAIINAAAVYARGGNGEGVIVAVIDSGINPQHSEFRHRLAGPGYNYIDNLPEVSADPLGHGTQMAGLIAANKDDKGMHGVAWGAKLLPMQFGAACKDKCDKHSYAFESDDQIARAWQDAFKQGARIMSNSWGNDFDPHILSEENYELVMPESLPVMKELVAKGDVVFIFPTGNEVRREPLMEAGLPYAVKGIEKGWLAVTAVKTDGKHPVITQKANACGVASQWCIAAPGGDGGAGMLTTDKNGGYSQANATSAAVAMVAGAMATIKHKYPHLTMQQVRDRLLKTADKRGIYANSQFYGQGLLDLDAASRADQDEF